MSWEWASAGKNPHYQAKRVFGQQGTDFQERVNFDRLRRERLAKLQSQMKQHDLSALLLMDSDNIRYATGTWDLTWQGASVQLRYCLVFPDRQPLLFEIPGVDLEAIKMNAPWLEGRIRPAISYLHSGPAFEFQLRRCAEQIKEALREHGVGASDRVGVDTLDFVSYEGFRKQDLPLVAAGQTVQQARLTKTADELELIKQSMAIIDSAFWWTRNEWVRPGVREAEIRGKIVDFCYASGCQWVWGANVASGGNTNPYLRAHSDKIIRPGDMVIIDIAMAAYNGYITDYARAWPCGTPFSRKQKELYKRCYDYLYRAVEAVRPGATTADVANAFPADDDFGDRAYGTCSLVQYAHAIGLGYQESFWISRGFSIEYPMPLQPNMFLAIETYAADPGGEEGVRLEENLVITDTGYEIFSLFPFEEEALR